MPKNSLSWVRIALAALLVLLVSSCYHRPHRYSSLLLQRSTPQTDTLSFYALHHYTVNYNFLVKTDSLSLMVQQPEEMLGSLPTDTFTVHKGDRLVVADFRMLSQDPTDSVWVQVATAARRFGWIHESELLPSVVPDDPISEFISVFSDTHLLIFLIVICIISAAYLIRKLRRMDAPIVHFRDIHSFYPTLLTLLVASAATLYASIQTFAPDVWRYFYYNPTLNPLSVPFILAVFLTLVWLMLIVGVAVLDDVRAQLPVGEAIVYLSGLAAVCAVDYIVFSITSLYFVGYLLLVFYFWYAIRQYLRHGRIVCVCGQCGTPLQHKGRCPHCGAIND